jgi:hypothetical protein
MNKYMDRGSLIVAVITLELFTAALFTKGISHDLFLETGVFLVSVKIIIMAYKSSADVNHLDKKMMRSWPYYQKQMLIKRIQQAYHEQRTGGT